MYFLLLAVFVIIVCFLHVAGLQENGNASPMGRNNSLPSHLSYDLGSEAYTRGIEVTQLNLTSAGELSFWDFSGYDSYYQVGWFLALLRWTQ